MIELSGRHTFHILICASIFPTFAHDTSTACSKQESEKTGKETARTIERINWPADSDENKGPPQKVEHVRRTGEAAGETPEGLRLSKEGALGL